MHAGGQSLWIVERLLFSGGRSVLRRRRLLRSCGGRLLGCVASLLLRVDCNAVRFLLHLFRFRYDDRQDTVLERCLDLARLSMEGQPQIAREGSVGTLRQVIVTLL